MSQISASLENYKEVCQTLSNLVIYVGVPSKKTSRKKEKKPSSITNAELIFIHEYGSPARNIPPRPILKETIKWLRLELIDYLTGIEKKIMKIEVTKSSLIKDLREICMEAENYCRDLLMSNDGTFEPNKPSWLEANRRHNEAGKKPYLKQDNHPLVDTGQLMRSIVCYLGDKDGNEVKQ